MGDKTHRHYKYTKFRQNPRGDPKFLVDLIWNDPSVFGKFYSGHSMSNQDELAYHLHIPSNLAQRQSFMR